MYQDGTTVSIVNQLKPGSYFKLKEDPTDSVYQIVSVTENLYNYAKTSKGDSNQGGWLNSGITNSNGVPEQRFYGLGDGTAAIFLILFIMTISVLEINGLVIGGVREI